MLNVTCLTIRSCYNVAIVIMECVTIAAEGRTYFCLATSSSLFHFFNYFLVLQPYAKMFFRSFSLSLSQALSGWTISGQSFSGDSRDVQWVQDWALAGPLNDIHLDMNMSHPWAAFASFFLQCIVLLVTKIKKETTSYKLHYIKLYYRWVFVVVAQTPQHLHWSWMLH